MSAAPAERAERLAELVAERELDQLIVGDLVRPGDSGRDAIAERRAGSPASPAPAPSRRRRREPRCSSPTSATPSAPSARSATPSNGSPPSAGCLPELASRLRGRVGFDDAATSVANLAKLEEALARGGRAGARRRAGRAAAPAQGRGRDRGDRRGRPARRRGLRAGARRAGLVGRTEREVARRRPRRGSASSAPSRRSRRSSPPGPNGALPHAEPSDREIATGELVVWDMGAIVDGYCSDCTRTFAAGEPDAEDAREVYAARPARAGRGARGGPRPASTAGDADEAARVVIRDAGHGDHFGHGLGHGVGLEIHEAPRLGPALRGRARRGRRGHGRAGRLRAGPVRDPDRGPGRGHRRRAPQPELAAEGAAGGRLRTASARTGNNGRDGSGCRRAVAARVDRVGPEGGVVSVYLAIDQADRSEGWRIELKDRLAGVDRAAAERILARFRGDVPPPAGRTQVGFVEVGGERRELWNGFQLDGVATEVVAAGRPYLAPLMRMLDDGSPLGVILVSLERVRVLDWALGQIEELDGWELEITSLDWHERKAPRRDPARGTGASASGRDQHAQRLEHNRERFLKQAGGLVVSRYGERPWRRIVVIGEGDRPRLLATGMGPEAELVHEVRQDLIRAAPAAIRRAACRGARAPQPQPRGSADRRAQGGDWQRPGGRPRLKGGARDARAGPGPARDLRRHARVRTAPRRARLRADDRARARHQGPASPRSRASPRRASPSTTAPRPCCATDS